MARADLSEMHALFCEEYVKHHNATKAYLAAGFSASGAAQSAYGLLKQNKGVQEYIKELRENAADTAGVTILRNAVELAKIAYGDVSRLRTNWMELREWEELTDDEKAILSEIQSETTTTYTKDGSPIVTEKVRFKVHDKIKAIETLNKMFGLNQPNKVELTGKNGTPLEITGMVIKKE